MKKVIVLIFTSLYLSCQLQGQQVITTNLIVQGSECIGDDCSNFESFGDHTLRLKENNTRINFWDTSVGTFPSNDWTLAANESTNGGLNCFYLEDATAGTIPFRILAGAGDNAFYLNSDGNLGLGNNCLLYTSPSPRDLSTSRIPSSA